MDRRTSIRARPGGARILLTAGFLALAVLLGLTAGMTSPALAQDGGTLPPDTEINPYDSGYPYYYDPSCCYDDDSGYDYDYPGGYYSYYYTYPYPSYRYYYSTPAPRFEGRERRFERREERREQRRHR